MIAGVLLRNYKNYGNLKFVRVCEDCDNMLSIFVGNNGVGKSAVLESLDLFFNNRIWNTTIGMKKTEAFICPVFLIPKSSVIASKKDEIEIISDYFWTNKCEANPNVKTTPALQDFIQYRNLLKSRYEKSHYFVLCGVSCDTGKDSFFGSFNKYIMDLLSEDSDEALRRANVVRDFILNRYTYLYIPVEESPKNLLQLQNDTMQKLLNKDILQEIERILTKSEDGSENTTIVKRINKNLDSFIDEVNSVISCIDSDYSFSAESGNKRNLTAKDIRAKIIEAYFPLRALKVKNKRVDVLSSGEQRKAIIDVAYSTLKANHGKKTDKCVVLAIDEPESSMHISNCFDQFLRLEELTNGECKNQVLITTHWYGFLPIVKNGNLHHLSQNIERDSTVIKSFNLYNVLENRKDYPDDIEMKSMFDLASSIISYMRQKQGLRWIVCEGSDDKLYLESILNSHEGIRIIPVGGCGNVVKLYQMIYGYLTEKNGGNINSNRVLFIIDTDLQMLKIQIPFQYSTEKPNAFLRRLQIIKDEVCLVDPLSNTTYNQTEMEDCLNPNVYWEALSKAIEEIGGASLKKAVKNVEFSTDAKLSVLKGDDSCIIPKEGKNIADKKMIIEFAENSNNKYLIAKRYSEACAGKKIKHKLDEIICNLLHIEIVSGDKNV